MAHAPHLRVKARELRLARRLTIDEIAERLALSRSTIYSWVRDLEVGRNDSRSGPRELARRRGTNAMRAKYRLLREEAYEAGRREFPELCARPTFRDFVCLYLAEGYKRSRNTLCICNSDPLVMKMSDRWLRELSTRPVSYAIQYHADQDLRSLQIYWGTLLDIEPDRIRFQRKSNSGMLAGRTWRSEFGVLKAETHDTYLRARMQAWIDEVRLAWL